jgi:catechol 2,3-dioxygenase-like lactoylglutathione lyase family enzyme
LPAALSGPKQTGRRSHKKGQFFMPSPQTETTVVNIHGPIISSSDLDAHVALFRAFGMEELGRVARSVDETLAIWGCEGQAATEVTLETPGTPFGLRLVGFGPGVDVQIRAPSRGSDAEALKVIDFYAPDLQAALASIEAAGFRFKEDIADYDTPEGRFQEAHLWGPDGVVCALISGEPDTCAHLATVRDRLVSEPQSISGPVQDPEATLAFLKDVLGLEVIHRYGVDDESFDALVGTSAALKLRAWNVGISTLEPYFGIIHYGLPEGSQTSLIDVARPPARGLLGATVRVRDAAAVAGKAGVEAVRTQVPGFGADVLVATFQGPNGAWFQAVQA